MHTTILETTYRAKQLQPPLISSVHHQANGRVVRKWRRAHAQIGVSPALKRKRRDAAADVFYYKVRARRNEQASVRALQHVSGEQNVCWSSAGSEHCDCRYFSRQNGRNPQHAVILVVTHEDGEAVKGQLQPNDAAQLFQAVAAVCCVRPYWRTGTVG